MIVTLLLVLEAGLKADVTPNESSGPAVTKEVAMLVGFEAYQRRSAKHVGPKPPGSQDGLLGVLV
jgi:hypothetical protein